MTPAKKNRGDSIVRRHARASSAGSIQGFGTRRGLFGLVCLCVFGLVAFLGSSASLGPGGRQLPQRGPPPAQQLGQPSRLPRLRDGHARQHGPDIARPGRRSSTPRIREETPLLTSNGDSRHLPHPGRSPRRIARDRLRGRLPGDAGQRRLDHLDGQPDRHPERAACQWASLAGSHLLPVPLIPGSAAQRGNPRSRTSASPTPPSCSRSCRTAATSRWRWGASARTSR